MVRLVAGLKYSLVYICWYKVFRCKFNKNQILKEKARLRRKHKEELKENIQQNI